MTKVFVNDIEVLVKKGSTALQACEATGIEIPRFCYHERLSIAGNCRMCLVEIEKTPKPVASCAMPLMEGMKIYTDTPLVKKAREAVLEFLLLNHPLDCPICDQGGECDLQDQALVFGSDRSRFYETKRSVEDKECGPLVKTIMTRCIHCTRCVRFSTEIAGVEDLGTTGRGEDTEIGTYVGKTLESELSGNVIDLCPVGALTSKPYAFTSRPWEIKSANSIDTSDGLGSNTRVDLRGTEILRVLPRFNEEINEEWISDKTRFMFDGFKKQRLTNIHTSWYHYCLNIIKHHTLSYLADWEYTIKTIRRLLKRIDPSRISVKVGGSTNLETQVILKDLLNKLGVTNITYEGISKVGNPDFSIDYSFNSTLSDIENGVDACLIINANPRFEASMLNTRLRKQYLKGGLEVAYVGPKMDLTFPSSHIGLGSSALYNFAEGKHSFCKNLIKAQNPLIILGENSAQNPRLTQNIVDTLTKVRDLFGKSKPTLCHLSTRSNQIGASTLGFYNRPYRLTDYQLRYSINTASDIPSSQKRRPTYKYKFERKSIEKALRSGEALYEIYQGHHMPNKRFMRRSTQTLLIPGAAPFEEKGTYINIEGRAQQSNRLQKGSNLTRDGWKIIKAIAGRSIPYCNQKELQDRIKKLVPNTLNQGKVLTTSVFTTINTTPGRRILPKKYTELFKPNIDNFYTTDRVARASKTMEECSQTFIKRRNFI
jgi:NADH dehydrogenase (ubiquinone) Fe-S protein 1